MGKTILRVLDGTVLSPALSSKLQELLPGYTLETFQAKPNYAASIKSRIESLHAAFNFLLEAYPLDPKFTYLTKETLLSYAASAKAKCNLTKTKVDELHKELEQFAGALVSVIQIAWPDTEKTKKAIACLNEAEQYQIMSKGRPNTATLSPMDYGRGAEYILQIDEALPAYYDQLLDELRLLKTHAFPQTPAWFVNLKPEEQAYLCNLGMESVTPEALIEDLQALLDNLTLIKRGRSHSIWTSDLDKISVGEIPLPNWYSELSKAKQEMIKILAGKSGAINEAITTFKTFLSEKNTTSSFAAELKQVALLPQWYLLLPKLQQFFLKQVINTAAKLEEAVFFLPSRLRMLPAPANFEAHTIVRIDKDGVAEELAARRYRSSHIVSRDLIKAKIPDAVRKRHSNANLAQVMRYAQDQALLLQTLISPIGIGDYIPSLLLDYLPELPPDKELDDELKDTVLGSKYATKAHVLNHPYNIAKRYYYTEATDPDSIKLIEETEASIAQIEDLKTQISTVEKEIARLSEPAKPTVKIKAEVGSKKTSGIDALAFAQLRLLALQKQLPKFHPKKDEIAELIEEYRLVLNSSLGSATVFDYKGRELFLSSLEQLITLAKNDYSYGSCVSGKDRKAIELIHTDAMIIYKLRYGVWPTFTDGELARKKFVAIVAALYLSRHQHVLAGQNAPGSEGLKTPEWYLPQDICDEINRQLEDSKAIQHDDRLATDNEVKNIFTNLPEVLIAENKLKATLTAKQLGEMACTELYSALFKLTDLPHLFQVPTKTKIARSLNIFTEYSALPEGIDKIKKLMHDPEAGNNNVERLAKIIEIILNRPSTDDARKPATVLVYESLSGLCQVTTPGQTLDDYVSEITKAWTECFNKAKERQAAKVSPPSSDDESVSPTM
ncbi:Dot/Icm T4SS effector PI-3-phosphatase SidP [Legionella sp. km772]|uniref:Dot/Icm T4SS effector PI-3-phosphatase SidP n=1 Tax=Legionella sp. km772 TaxID=2498111 RepID=UPI000F8C52F5|nr:Dot/Icm T4SS effector PI-3-phosphatase SidP [Legionella sp. km772]RUR12882.1 oxidoreductase [Legionella sp. km772]